MALEKASLPKISLSRSQWVRLAIVGLLVIVAIGRVVPDFVRIVYPLNVFSYITNGDGVVIGAPRTAPKGSDRILIGDRVRIDRIKPFDRKPGLSGFSFTYDNPDRRLPIERGGRERVLHLIAHKEAPPSRFLAVLRILLFLVSVGLGAMLFLMKPSIATASFFFFCLGGEAPTTYADLLVPNPWRPVPEWLGDVLRGAARPALLLFALCLIDGDEDAPRERIFAYAIGTLGLILGTLHAYGVWLQTYAALPAQSLDRLVSVAGSAVTALTTLVFAIAFVRARGVMRQRIAWIVIAFALAGVARLTSDALFPGHIPLWFNSLLLSSSVVPIVIVWIAVVRQNFFNVDFVVSRAIVYVALTAAIIGTLTISEEFATYLFYNNTDFAYGVLIAVSMAVGAFTGKIKTFIDRIVDRFIFRDRRAQRLALEFIAGYILDAETAEDVYRALLHDAAHALKLSFGGLLTRRPDGSFALTESYDWPPDCVVQLGPDDRLTQAITRSRGILTFSGKESAMIKEAFPGERLTFAAPLFAERDVSAIVVYGHSVVGLDLDPEERELLIRVVAHASIALNAIELARYRKAEAARGLNVSLLGSG